jgi:hypothetical protein
MSTPFIDLEERDYERKDEADERRQHLKIVRNTMAGGFDENDALDREASILTQDFADTTDAVSLLLTHLKFEPELRAFVDAVIGAVGGADGYVEVPDPTIAKRMGRSTKSVQRYRDEFRELKDHGAVIEIKDNWRDPQTLESHAHAYRVHIDKLAVEAMQNARISPEWNRDRRGRLKALEEAAQTVGDSAPCFPPRKVKKRRKPSDAEMLRRNLKQSAELIGRATALRPMVRNPDYDELYEFRQQLADQLKAFDDAYGLESDFHANTGIRSMETDAPSIPEPSAKSPRMEAENEVDTQVDTAQVDKLSTQNDSTESTTYENQEFSSTEFSPPGGMTREAPDEPETVDDGAVDEEFYYPPGISDEEANAMWERTFGGLKGGARDATAAT